MSDNAIGAIAFGFLGLVVFGGMGGCAYVYPQYNVYSQRMAGQAEFARAEANRRIEVETARAKLDAADLTAQAEVRRAHGVAEANKVIANSLGGPEGYLRWRYIEMLEGQAGGGQIIYVPTEAGLPVLEAGRLNQ